jgi:hypothetical protein
MARERDRSAVQQAARVEIDRELVERVRRQAAEQGRSERGLIEEMLEESIRVRRLPGIAFRGGDGVLVSGPSTGLRISRNSIFSNGGLGIVPSVSVQNTPVLTSAKTVSGKTTIKGTLGSTAGKIFTIEFFSNPSGDEGKKFIGQKSVTTDSSGNASFTFTPTTAVSVGRTVTATATSDSTHDTSGFSAPRKVG